MKKKKKMIKKVLTKNKDSKMSLLNFNFFYDLYSFCKC